MICGDERPERGGWPSLDAPVIGLRPPLVLRTDKPCASCREPIAPGQLYTLGPPVRHVSCPKR